MSRPPAVLRYLQKSALQGAWSLGGSPREDFYGAVVIPSLAEGDSLFATLASLAANPRGWLDRFLIVIVINHAEEATSSVRRQNADDLCRLASVAGQTPLQLAWIDAASDGHEVPLKQAGVGFARKLGMDRALSRLAWSANPVLVCLDADTLVESNYLSAIASHFSGSQAGAAVLPFCHQPGQDSLQQSAIDRYELFLRSYVYGLRLAGSPYAFNSVGSAIACLASAYVRCGGMNCRKAAEDFYFLQKLAKTDGVDLLSGTRVYPAARVSARVPFGTGRSMGRLLDGDDQAVLFYPAAVFRLLGDWLQAVNSSLRDDAGQLLQKAGDISPVLADYLQQSGWLTVWPQLQATQPTLERCHQAFHGWFDGFRTMRLIHLLCESGCQRGQPEVLLPGYFAWEGCSCPASLSGMLEQLRIKDGL